MKTTDIAGQRFGRALVISRAANDAHANARWRCLCDCGQAFDAAGYKLRNGHTRSCGCLRSDFPAAKTHGMSDTRLFRIWTGMRTRCKNSNAAKWHRYGGRGIAICEEWGSSFETFMRWALANGYAEHLSIDRKNNEGPYSPDNCKWSSNIEQARNTSRTYLPDGRTFSEVAAMLGITATTLRTRIKDGWPIAAAIATPNLKPWSRNGHSHP